MAERSVSTNNAMTKKIVYSHIAAQAVGQVTKGEGEKGRSNCQILRQSRRG
jgi:hypothetical protein